jgi:KaiC/GvpD/RAD55 family RecA-like ATPase
MVKVVLYTIAAESYFKGVICILRTVGNKNLIYVTTNKPYQNIVTGCKKSGIKSDRIFFIDCISKHIGVKAGESANCLFIDSPQSLTTIGIAINEATKNLTGETVLLLDSLSTMLLYNDANTIGRFSNFIINKMRAAGIGTIVLALESDIEKDIIHQVTSFVDEVKKYGS